MFTWLFFKGRATQPDESRHMWVLMVDANLWTSYDEHPRSSPVGRHLVWFRCLLPGQASAGLLPLLIIHLCYLETVS